MLRTIAAIMTLLALTCSAATSAEWGPVPAASPFVIAGFKHDDGGALFIWCNTKVRLISIMINEPRARWEKGATMDVTVRSDDGTQLAPSKATVVGPTQLVIAEQATFDLVTMGKANRFFATGVGGFARIFPTTNFKKSTAPVLAACGDHW